MEKNTLTYKIVVGLAIAFQIFSLVIMILYFSHDCPEQKTIVEVNQEYVEHIKEISNAETKNDIDSLLVKWYGFKSK